MRGKHGRGFQKSGEKIAAMSRSLPLRGKKKKKKRKRGLANSLIRPQQRPTTSVRSKEGKKKKKARGTDLQPLSKKKRKKERREGASTFSASPDRPKGRWGRSLMHTIWEWEKEKEKKALKTQRVKVERFD